MIHVELTDKPIDIASAMRVMAEAEPRSATRIDGTSHGASLMFTGVVRNRNQGKAVVAVSYDAFAPLCEKTLRELCDEAQARYGCSVTLVHRMGRLEVGEISVLLAVSTPHRAEAYASSRYLIENLKMRAPIWKKETYVDGESEWLHGHALCAHHLNERADRPDWREEAIRP